MMHAILEELSLSQCSLTLNILKVQKGHTKVNVTLFSKDELYVYTQAIHLPPCFS